MLQYFLSVKLTSLTLGVSKLIFIYRDDDKENQNVWMNCRVCHENMTPSRTGVVDHLDVEHKMPLKVYIEIYDIKEGFEADTANISDEGCVVSNSFSIDNNSCKNKDNVHHGPTNSTEKSKNSDFLDKASNLASAHEEQIVSNSSSNGRKRTIGEDKSLPQPEPPTKKSKGLNLLRNLLETSENIDTHEEQPSSSSLPVVTSTFTITTTGSCLLHDEKLGNVEDNARPIHSQNSTKKSKNLNLTSCPKSKLPVVPKLHLKKTSNSADSFEVSMPVSGDLESENTANLIPSSR